MGGQIGYAWTRDNGSINNPAPGIPGLPPSIFLRFTVNPQGVIGGAHIGYNLQFNHWVVGLEADVDGTSLSKTMLVGAFPPFFQGLLTTKTTVQGSIRARAGIAFDRVLIYAVTNNWSVWAENRYSDFGSRNDFSAIALFPNFFVRHHLTENQVQAGFSYKFDSLAPAPVVAKY